MHRSSRYCMAQKDAQNKDSLNPRSTEYSKSGSDDFSAATEKAAFDPSSTSPEEAMDTADKESGEETSPLDVSPANQEVSQPRGASEGGAEGSAGESGQTSERQRTSGRGSPQKGGGAKSG